MSEPDSATTRWDQIYTASEPPPWDIGRPQPAFVRLADRGLLSGNVLDAGCGTGEHALLATRHGADAVGVDLAAAAIEQARAKAHARGLRARFEVADALNLSALGLRFDTIIDSGLFHVFDEADRTRYVASLASVLDPGGTCYLMCFSDREPAEWVPRRVSQDELRAAFADGWTIETITAETVRILPIDRHTKAQTWLAVITRR
jgi:cyclopropane fatty-acyl-phospholipid synthase-like methyltransferase